MESVDVILVSNWTSLVALPFYTEGTGFRGRVYATDPTIQFGRLLMEEMIEYFERIVLNPVDQKWKDPAVYNTFLNYPTRSPLEWKSFYDREVMEKSLSRVRLIAFKESIVVEGNVTVSAYCSGYSIGSCNWVIATEQDKQTAMNLADAVLSTVANGGSAILPVSPCGVIFDFIEIIAKRVDLDTPVYFISPVAKKALAYASIYGEWLSEGRLNCLYQPEEPFSHAALIKSNRVKVFDSLYGDFSREHKSPCVVFTGHPSLRIGDAPHLIEKWGMDPRNALILSDPDYPPSEVYGPFEDLPIRMFFYPVDTRLDYTQLNTNILSDLAPKKIYLPEAYNRPLKGKHNSSVEYGPITVIRQEETIQLSSAIRKRKITVHPEIARGLNLRGISKNNEVLLCSLRGMLSCYDNIYELLPIRPETRLSSGTEASIASPVKKVYAGKVNADSLLRAFQVAGFPCKVTKTEDGEATLFQMDELNATVRLSSDGLATRIRAPKEHRQRLYNIVSKSLVSF